MRHLGSPLRGIRYHGGPRLAGDFRRIAERRGTNKARVAVARKVLTLVYYGLRDGEIRCLAQAPAACGSDTTRRELVIGITPASGGEVDELLEARLVVAATHHARQPDRRRDASAAELLPPLRSRGPRCDTPTPTQPPAPRRPSGPELNSASSLAGVKAKPPGVACGQP